jgi:hypothetical protein
MLYEPTYPFLGYNLLAVGAILAYLLAEVSVNGFLGQLGELLGDRRTATQFWLLAVVYPVALGLVLAAEHLAHTSTAHIIGKQGRYPAGELFPVVLGVAHLVALACLVQQLRLLLAVRAAAQSRLGFIELLESEP